MKANTCTFAVGLSVLFAVSAAPQDRPAILAPPAGVTIANRLNFRVEVSVPQFHQDVSAGFHYWVSVALGHGTPTSHWPKFYVKDKTYVANASDGGTNPYPQKEPATILLLRVDGARNQAFLRWLNAGKAPKTWEGLGVVPSEVVARTEVYFP